MFKKLTFSIFISIFIYIIMSDTYYQKYLKYKNKYLSLKAEVEGGATVRTPLIEEALIKLINMVNELSRGRGTRADFIRESLNILGDLDKIYTAGTEIGEASLELEEVYPEIINAFEKYETDRTAFFQIGANAIKRIEAAINIANANRNIIAKEMLESKKAIYDLILMLGRAWDDNKISEKEKAELNTLLEKAKKEIDDLKREKQATKIQTAFRTTKSQAEIKQLEQENEKLINQQKRVNDAVNRLTDFFRNRVVTPVPAVLIR